MKAISYFFFYTYISLVIIAGFWGAFINPTFDFTLLFRLDVQSLPDFQRVHLLSQYRFLRALELGYGLFAVLFVRQIFSERKFNLLFLTIMSLGVLARIFSFIFDGAPGNLFYLFFFWEILGVIFISIYTHKIRITNAKS